MNHEMNVESIKSVLNERMIDNQKKEIEELVLQVHWLQTHIKSLEQFATKLMEENVKLRYKV